MVILLNIEQVVILLNVEQVVVLLNVEQVVLLSEEIHPCMLYMVECHTGLDLQYMC